MPGAKKYKPQRSDDSSPVQPGMLPTDRSIAVYYRQSSMKQVGNISTDMQQIDLPRYVMSLGWQQEDVVLIDEDEGVSGAKSIDERAEEWVVYNDAVPSQRKLPRTASA